MDRDVWIKVGQVQFKRQDFLEAPAPKDISNNQSRPDFDIQNIAGEDNLSPDAGFQLDAVVIDAILLPEAPERPGGHIQRLLDTVVLHHFNPSFWPCSSKAIDSTILRFCVSGLLATAIQAI